LVELLTVIAIIGILAAILFPALASAKKSARASQAISNAKQIGMATLLYAQENRGQILAHGYDVKASGSIPASSGYAYTELMFRRWATYLVMSPTGSSASEIKQSVVNSLTKFADPAVPSNLLDISYGSYGTTWTVNSALNVNGGRSAMGIGSYDSIPRPIRMNELSEPSRTLYAVSGSGYEINASNIVNATLLNPTGDVKFDIYYFHRDGKATPAVFLDGHTEMMTFPINPKLTQLKNFN
jgi:type II secretory pathway pseudopilin PulG